MRRSGCSIRGRRLCRRQEELRKNSSISLRALRAVSLGAPAILYGQVCKSKPLPNRSDWPVYGGQVEGDHYSPLSQINRTNEQIFTSPVQNTLIENATEWLLDKGPETLSSPGKVE